MLKKSLGQFTDQTKKRKKYCRVGNELSIKDNIKALRYKSCLSFGACQKKIVKFTDSTNKIYWQTNIAKKQQTVEKNVCVSWHFQNVMNNL